MKTVFSSILSGVWGRRLRRAAVALCAASFAAFACGCGIDLPSQLPFASHEAAAPSESAPLSGLVLNEAVAVNSRSHTDETYGSADWVELKNVSSKALDISGWRMGDKPSMQPCLTFPEGTVLEPGALMTVICVSEPREGDIAAPFGISRTGEKLYFADGAGQLACFEVPALTADISWARADDGSYGYCASPTFGQENSAVYPTLDEAAAGAGTADALRISELMHGKEGWAELVNASGETADLSDYYLSDDPADPAKWHMPPHELAPGEYAVIELNDADPDSPFTASFRLNRSETGLYLFSGIGREVDRLEFAAGLPDGVSVVSVNGGAAYTAVVTKGGANSSETFAEAVWHDDGPDGMGLIINEVLADNKYGITDMYGNRSDWAELLNTTENPIVLSYYYLSDDPADPLKYRLPNISLLPGKYALVFLSGEEGNEAEIHAPFKLAEGETLYLSCLNGMGQDHIDIPEGILPNVSVGRNSEDEVRYYSSPTPGAPNSSYGLENYADAGGFNARGVYISEVCAVSPARSGGHDWIELTNRTGAPVTLSGWHITDDPDKPDKYALDKVSIKAGGYAVINPFSVSAAGDTLYLFNEYSAVCDVFETGVTRPGVTSGREELSQSGARVYFETPTKGYKNASPLPAACAEPVLSRTGLYASESFNLTITCSTAGAEIRYTDNGSDPTQSSKLYTGPITVSKSTVIKARAFGNGLLSSPVAVHTYVFKDAHTLPVVTLSMSQSDYQRMYVSNMNSNGAVTKGDEVPCFMEYYVDGRPAISSGAGVRVSGASTATYPQKSLGLYFRAGYGRSSLDYPLFEDGVNSFRSLVLRNGGQDAYYAHIRDSFVSRMAKGFNVDYAPVQPVIVYINGEYRGVYDLKENLNEDFVAAHHGVSRGTVEIAKRNGYMLTGSKDGWNKMLNMCKTLDMSKKENFDKLSRLVDTDSIIDYLILRSYFYDWDMFNQKYWHTSDDKVKWRAVLYDSDFALSGNNPGGSVLSAYFNRSGVTSAHGYVTQMDIFCALNENPGWRDKFITRYIHAVKARFNSERALKVYDGLVGEYRPEMRAQISRWHMPSSYEVWDKEVSALRTCISKRPDNALRILKSFYGLSDSKFAEYEKLANQMG